MVKKAVPANKPPSASARPVGRPSSYTDEVADIICDRMINGENFSQICADPMMPSRAALYRWRASRPDFDARCARAREALADFLLDKIEAMADETTEANVNSQRLKISTAQWRAEKMAPRTLGPRVNTEITSSTVHVQHTTIDVRQLDAAARDAFKQALLAARTIEHDPNEGQG
ncbi:hypothetical protein UFOVP120_24 [uncultured Caudovirales phage]|uniref:Terminase small subunit n=1 Tax=uncultured Caudovirales phage TaxID=2100421 RepID=A0A6J5L853_9CAUD|nr:hypothetical protein UFOVP120_24 [uncultured Caudovirales phage]